MKRTSRNSWTDFNLGSATISIDCDQFQIVIPADTVKGAAISSTNGLLTVRLELSAPLNVEGEDASLMQLEFPLDYAVAVPTILHQLLGQRLQMDQRLRSSRSASIRLSGSAATRPVLLVDNQPRQDLSVGARLPSRRKSSSSGVLMCRKETLLESPVANQEPVDAGRWGDASNQEEGQRLNTPPTREAGARASRAKVMEERRRELERSISQVQSNSKVGGKAAETLKKDATSRCGPEDIEKRKRSLPRGPFLLPGSPGLHSVVAEASSQDLILLVVRDLSNFATVGVLEQIYQRWFPGRCQHRDIPITGGGHQAAKTSVH